MMGGRDDAGGRIGVGRSEVEWWIREDGTHTHDMSKLGWCNYAGSRSLQAGAGAVYSETTVGGCGGNDGAGETFCMVQSSK